MRWLDTRQAIGKGYQRALCTPTDADKKDGARVFTGERLGTGAQTLHVLGEEAYRSYLLLSKWTDSSLTLTVETMGAAMGERLDQHYNGRYCCGPCSVSVWRALIAGGYSKNEERLELAMKYLHSKRDASGRWGNLPFFYTVLTLSEMETPPPRTNFTIACQLAINCLNATPPLRSRTPQEELRCWSGSCRGIRRRDRHMNGDCGRRPFAGSALGYLKVNFVSKECNLLTGRR
jgi:hypothetical protein